MSNRIKGSVKWFSQEKGYGFIIAEDEKVGDVFVHYSDIDTYGYKNLKEGERVTFEVEDSPKGKKAVKVAV